MKRILCKAILGSLLLVAIIFHLSSCGGDAEDPAPVEENLPPPVINAISPTAGIGEMRVTITGKNFNTKPAENSVTFNGVSALVNTATATELIVTVPMNGSSGDVAVQTGDKKTVGPSFHYYEVFVVGNDFTGGGKCKIQLWRGAVRESITDGTANILSTHVGVSGEDVYISGYDGAGTGSFVWKNKVKSTLQTGLGSAEKVAIDGSDVYVLGTDIDGTKYWKNGNEVSVPAPESYLGNLILGMHVIDGDVYLAGNATPDFNKFVPLYWKNGVENFLTIDEDDDLVVTDMTIDGEDIYVIGSISIGSIGRARYWKNNVVTYLTDGTTQGYTSSLVVDDGDIYVAGGETINGTGRPRVWKNGSLLSFKWIEDLDDEGYGDTFIVDMTIIDGDFIFAGDVFKDGGKRVSYIAVNDQIVFLPAESFTCNARGMVAR